MNSATTSALKRLAGETTYLSGLVENLTREKFQEDPTIQRAAAFSLRIIQHNLISLRKSDIHPDSPLAAAMVFDFKPDQALCISYKRAPIALERQLMWKYLEQRLPILRDKALSMAQLLPQSENADADADNAADDDEDAAKNENGESVEAAPMDPRLAEWNRVLMAYNTARHQCQANAGQVRRWCALHEIAIANQECRDPEELERLKEIVAAKELPQAENDDIMAHLDKTISDIHIERESVSQIERVAAVETDMLRAYQVPELSAVGALAVMVMFPNPALVNQKTFIAHIGYAPRDKRGGKLSEDEIARRQILRRALDEAAKSVYETPDDTSSLYLWARKEQAGKPAHLVIHALGRKLAGMLWHFVRAHPFKDVRIQHAFALKLSRFASRLGEDFIRGLGFESCPDYVTQTCARFYTAQPADNTDAPVSAETSAEAEPPAPAEPVEEPVKVLMKIKGKLRFVDPDKIPDETAQTPVAKKRPGRPRKTKEPTEKKPRASKKSKE